MLWRSKCLLVRLSYQSTKTQFLSSIHSLYPPIDYPVNIHQSSSSTEHFCKAPATYRIILTPQVVESTLLNCHSDLISLCFFLWCAKQPNYFHQKGAFAHMVNVVSRLTQRFRTLKGLLDELENVGSVIKAGDLLLFLRIYWFGGMHSMVFMTFEEMLRYGYTPNTFARNILMDVLFKIGRVGIALQVLKETQVPNFLTFSTAVYHLCKLKDLVNLQGVLRSMLRKGYYLKPETFSFVLSCYCKLGQLAEATQLLGLMIVLGIPTSVRVWSILIDGYSKSGRLDIADYLLAKMIAGGCTPNIVACTSLIKGYLESQMTSKAFEILAAMESKGCYPDLVMCNVLIDCLSKIGSYDDAIDVFCSLTERGLTPDSYTLSSIMSTICLSKEFILLPILISGLDITADLVVCNSFLSYFCKAGYPAGAVEFYNDIIDRGFQPDKYTFTGLLSGLCRLGKTSQAVNVYWGIVKSQHGLDAHIHTVIINELIKCGEFHQAIRLFRKAVAEKFQLDVVSYTVALDGLLKGGLVGDAYILFNEMKEIGLAPNIHTYNLMLSRACKDGDVRMIKKILLEINDRGLRFNHITFRLMKKLLHKSHHSSLVFNLFMELWDSGLLPRNIQRLVFDKANCYLNVKDAHIDNPLLVLDTDTDTSSSEDIPDVAVSVG
ncbi:putative pentatricopeptide repeat-containing protein At1g16830 isoform X1 [Ipomoea triloba]|uniref:putative pentatricopeptide repeat-containing protein At1g16830 isoform X1 n=1 Tax=Ipomoea triloba TaxID=35885 RepID=UPI00125E8411|nr:putative pentatricopeptide repeat-containing protein At1g16830 isoform X1 [Ipomoea triloba]XP_031131526.1 putative pentatricopeptide repeat-containing protein At1g16830 isoform X1 [Ipomoea triloba]XP_031131527.1 putative pentatricopeptide repeat-containing protein At1g16830 isoform X1 [Ipomoea triloba]XP_031131528.1 putative pentatricopeptide repeat-containing protein At1g16830 isoform X1 [Ipomoea triloba]XP_031131530.1 putative pentatricopeptide repeat-containing protein At1g16830 isoform X